MCVDGGRSTCSRCKYNERESMSQFRREIQDAERGGWIYNISTKGEGANAVLRDGRPVAIAIEKVAVDGGRVEVKSLKVQGRLFILSEKLSVTEMLARASVTADITCQGWVDS